MLNRKYTLIGVNGNAFAIMGYTAKAMRNAGFTKDEIDQMYKEAEESDYNHLICVCDGYIDEVNDRLGLNNDEEWEVKR